MLLVLNIEKFFLKRSRWSKTEVSSDVGEVLFVVMKLEPCWSDKFIFVLWATRLSLALLLFLYCLLITFLTELPKFLHRHLDAVTDAFKDLETMVHGRSQRSFLDVCEFAHD